MDKDWKEELDRAHAETIRLFDEFSKHGYTYKRAEIRFVGCDYPTWRGKDEESGVVTIDPGRHEPRCIAHELGHGFHECLRRDLPHLWHDDATEGETVAETIRFFVEQRMNHLQGKEWLPPAKYSAIIEACDYKLGGPTGFDAMLWHRWTIDQLREHNESLCARQLTPEYRALARQQELADIQAIRQRLGRHVVVVFRKGGRIKEERRYDSQADSTEEVMGVQQAIGLALPIGPQMIGKGWIGFLPWDSALPQRTNLTPQEQSDLQCPVRIADVVENTDTGITTVYLESV